MKYILFVLLFATALLINNETNNPPVATAIPVEEAFISVKKSFMKCLLDSENASDILKAYAQKIIDGDYKEKLDFKSLNLDEKDNKIVLFCRNKSSSVN